MPFHAALDISHVRRFLRLSARARRAYGTLLLVIAPLCGCSIISPAPPAPAPDSSRGQSLIAAALPRSLPDREGWVADLYAAFSAQSISVSRENVCAVVAVIQQESSFRVNPAVPNLPAIARREIDVRADQGGVPKMIVHGALQLSSPNGKTYGERIDAARTEKDLSDIFEDFIAAVPLGTTLFADHNPIRTRGPMQVNVAFAREYAAARPYPYPVNKSVEDELFTRRGGLYFGTAHLLAYRAPYDQYLFRFADFNAGQFSSRNAAFQIAIGAATGTRLTPDGALLAHGGAASTAAAGPTESALRALAPRLGSSDSAIHDALQMGRSADLEQTPLYARVFALAAQKQGRDLPRAAIPRIELHGPKITRHLTTEWYARRVDARFASCLKALSE